MVLLCTLPRESPLVGRKRGPGGLRSHFASSLLLASIMSNPPAAPPFAPPQILLHNPGRTRVEDVLGWIENLQSRIDALSASTVLLHQKIEALEQRFAPLGHHTIPILVPVLRQLIEDNRRLRERLATLEYQQTVTAAQVSILYRGCETEVFRRTLDRLLAEVPQ